MLPSLLSFVLVASVQPATSTLEVDLEGLRNSRGVIRACLMQDKATFPRCGSDRRAIRKTGNAGETRLVFGSVPPGRYALALFHDENANNQLDTVLGIPREGFGFSRNPLVRFGAPRFDQVDIEIPPGFTRISVRLQYLL